MQATRTAARERVRLAIADDRTEIGAKDRDVVQQLFKVRCLKFSTYLLSQRREGERAVNRHQNGRERPH